MTEVKPCLFCKGRNVLVGGTEDAAHVYCTYCGAEGPAMDFTEEEAIAAWNKAWLP